MRNKILGILGGGQLGRMSAQAASQLGIDVVIFTPEENAPASAVSKKTICANYDDKDALTHFSELVDIITYEFENIPIETVDFLTSLKPVFPDKKLLEVSQDRIIEKSFLKDIGIDTTRWKKYKSEETITDALKEWKSNQLILKTARFGYDGKGQVKYDSSDSIIDTVNKLNGDIIVEEIIDFSCEISVICARDVNKNSIVYGPMLNAHKNHILHKTTIPSGISDELTAQSISMVKKLAEKIDLQGVLTLELFVTKDGRLLANEIAPRTHNSGHWSIDACLHSQFDQHVRSVCGLPVVEPNIHSDAEMLNLIGDDIGKIEQYLLKPNAYVHDYGKVNTRAGRKMGHVNFLKEKS